jgi:hypothetical protein
MPCEPTEQPLSRSALEDTGAPSPMVIMMAGLQRIFVYLTAARRARRHVAAPELPRAGRGSPSRGDTWHPRSCPEPGTGARAVGTRGGPGAARAGSGSSCRRDTWQPQSCPQPGGGSRCLDLKVVRGIPDLQGVDRVELVDSRIHDVSYI